MKSKIIVDSSANVYELPDVGFACVPLKILTDEQEYVDTAEVDAPALAQMMRTYKGRTSTSCPNISDWMAAYEGADEVYVVTITGTLSGAYNAALLAGASRVTINAWIKSRRCIGVSHLRRGFKLPRWQFEPNLWPILQPLASALGASDGWQVLTFLETPASALDGQTPRAALEQGVPAKHILALATAEAH